MRNLNVKRMVIKVGTHTLTREDGRLDRRQLERVVEQVSLQKREGIEVALVTSGAIAAGVEVMGLKERPREIPALQAAASVGQVQLIHLYAELFAKFGCRIGQVLLTQYDIARRQQYLNARNALNHLIGMGIIPVINENDTVAVEEIRFGDNDRLAALVAGLIEADLLVLLTDTEGLYTADPSKVEGAELVREVPEITSEIERLAEGTSKELATGGMITKIQAARVATSSRVGVVIANGRERRVLSRIVEGREVGTYFPPRKKVVGGRKRWIAFGSQPAGRIVIDRGAKEALIHGGKSLLPAGIVSCEGDFRVGDTVEIVDEKGKLLGRGLINYTASEVERIKGLHSREAARLLGETSCKEAVHRDCLVLLDK
jgi:glutamate 5-kinase